MSNQLLAPLLLLWVLFANVANAAEGCKPQSKGTPGFDISLYHYPFPVTGSGGACYSDYYQTTEFQQGGYQTFGKGLFGTATGIEDVTLDLKLATSCTEIMGTLPSNFNYGETFSVSNFTMLLTGYFLPQQSGQYIFNLVADDLAYLSFGAGNAFECCDEEGSVSDPEAFDLIVTWKADDNMSGSVTYNLIAGVYYPLRLLYANREYHGTLKLSFQDPSGTVHTDFTDHIYQFPDEPEGCPNTVHTSTTMWTGTYTSTFLTTVWTTTGTDGIATTETLYVVETPDDRTHISTATTEYTQGTADVTTTYSTATGVVTGTDGIITSETTYYVETPTSRSKTATATTTYSEGTADITTTYSTATGVYTGTDGVITTETTFFVETPTSRPETATATTVFTEGTVDETTTYSTATGVYTGTDGIITTETTFYVEKPGPETTITTVVTDTIYSSGVEPTTETSVTTYTSSDVEVIETDIHEVMVPTIAVSMSPFLSTTEYLSTITGPTTDSGSETDVETELPSVEETITTAETTTEFGSVTTPTTITHVTTYLTTNSDSETEEIVETDVEVELPSVEETITTAKTTTEFGSVTVPTTVTHVTTYYTTDSDGEEEEIVETDVEVELPSVSKTVTTVTTVYTEGQVTGTTTVSTIVSTYYTTDKDGNEEEVVETEYVVEVPDVSKTIITATTEYTDYPGSVTTTITHVTTYLTTDSDGNEEEVVETDIIIETPKNPNTGVQTQKTTTVVIDNENGPESEIEEITKSSTIYTYYTGSVTSTYSTNVRTYTTTDRNGNEEEVVETDYYVEIPRPTSNGAIGQGSTATHNVVNYSSASATSTTANVSNYHGVGSNISNNVYTFVVGLLFAVVVF